jgi:hypothetical protein
VVGRRRAEQDGTERDGTERDRAERGRAERDRAERGGAERGRAASGNTAIGDVESGDVTVQTHHGFDTEYDATKKVSLSGVVTQVAWTNPHMRVYVDVTDKDGTVTNWNLELTSPNSVRRQGWGVNDLKPGDKVTFEGFGGKEVFSRGSLSRIAKVGDDRPLFVQGGPQGGGGN